MTQPVTPEQEEQVRRALAAAARAEDAETPATMPPAVAARLDGVLAELVQSRSTAQAASPARGRGPDDLAAHRARRRLNVLVAAAALAVIAAAGGAVVTGGLGGAGGSSDGGAASSDSRASGLADDQVSQPEAAAPTAPSGRSAVPVRGVPRLRTSTLAADVRRVVRSGAVADQSQDARKLAVRPDGSACDRPTVPRGADVVAVRLDGEPATLVIDRVTGGTREARVYSCGDASAPMTSTAVPAP